MDFYFDAYLEEFVCYLLIEIPLFQQPTQAQWKKVFYIAGGIYIFCGTFYNVFASGRRQEWDNPADDEANAKKAADKKANKQEQKAAKNQSHAETAHI